MGPEFAEAIQRFPHPSQRFAKNWVRDVYGILGARLINPSIKEESELEDLRTDSLMPVCAVFKSLAQFSPKVQGILKYESSDDSIHRALDTYRRVLHLYTNGDSEPVTNVLRSTKGIYNPYCSLYSSFLGDEYHPANGLFYSLAQGIVTELPLINPWSALSQLARFRPERLSFATDDTGVERIDIAFNVRDYEIHSGEPVKVLKTSKLSFTNPFTQPLQPMTIEAIRNGNEALPILPGYLQTLS